MIDLAALGADCVSDAAYGMETLDLETLQDAARDGAYSAADNACIYYRDCMEIVSRYESAFGDDVEPTGATFEAHQWQEALAAYACGIAQNVISQDVENALERVKECADSLYEAAEELGCEDVGNPAVSDTCIHGWAVHERELEDGTCIWQPAQLEGCRAVAINAGAFWLSYTWTPSAV